ncbi:MAG: F0F1 ATP synthase subunit A [Oscillospiraceae bacterium]|nr:F0F1 ATP synthase subunit A [Oscillospiraceae bacterium]
MNVSVDGAFVYFTLPIFGGIPITQTAVSSFVVTALLVIACIRLGKNLQKRPSGTQVLVEKGVSMIYNLTVSAMGEHNAHWAPFMGTLFLSSIFGSLIGMTGFLRSVTADLSCTLTWSLMVTALIWYHNIKNNGFFGWLKGFTEPIVVMTPMNIVSEIAQPVSMAFRHFGNVAGGGVITSIIYTAFSLVSALVLNAIASAGWLMGAALMAAGVGLWLLGSKKKKLIVKILAAVSFVLGLFGLLQAAGILSGVPVLALGVPALLSVYFDVFSGFVQALVFTLLSMVYIAGACPPKQEQ